jgi:hypothetical protein
VESAGLGISDPSPAPLRRSHEAFASICRRHVSRVVNCIVIFKVTLGCVRYESKDPYVQVAHDLTPSRPG